MDLKQLQQFITLTETLNFRRAADILHIAQPALSVSLRRLEEELGVRLFDRGRHGVALTSAGAAALPEARRAVEHAARVRQHARSGADGHMGKARLGFVGTAAYDILPRTLIAFRNRYPGVDIELLERVTTDALSELVLETLDIAIVRFPTEVPPGLVMEEIEPDTIGVALPPGHPLARFESVALSDLAEEPFIFPSMTQTPSLFHTNMARCQMAGFSPRIVQQASQVQTIIGLVQGGIGVALVPSLTAKAAWRRVAFRTLSDVNPMLRTGLALLHDPKRINRPAQRFREVLLEVASLDQDREELAVDS